MEYYINVSSLGENGYGEALNKVRLLMSNVTDNDDTFNEDDDETIQLAGD